MTTRALLAVTAGKKIAPEKETARDREELILYLLAKGVQHGRIEVADGTRLYFVFDIDDISSLEQLFVSNSALPVDFHDVLRALSTWKSAVNMLRMIRPQRFSHS